YANVLGTTGGHIPLTWTLVSGQLPPGITLSTPVNTSFTGFQQASLNGSPTAAGQYPFTIRVSDASGDTTTVSMTITITGPPVITTTSLPSGTVGTPYSTTVTVQQGTPPYSWALNIGGLPSGLTLDPTTGAITGTPVLAGTSNFSIRVTDSSSPQQVATQGL